MELLKCLMQALQYYRDGKRRRRNGHACRLIQTRMHYTIDKMKMNNDIP